MKNNRRTIWPDGKRAAISLSFDDARPSQLDRGIPLLNRHGVRATFYVSPAAVELRLKEWRDAVAHGHEIGNHTLTHPCSGNFPWSRCNALEDYTLARMEKDIRAANREIHRLLGVRPATFAYPCGQKIVGRGARAKTYVPLVAKHFLAGRGYYDEIPNDAAFCDLAQLNGTPADGVSFEQFKRWAEATVQIGGWLILVAHEVSDNSHSQAMSAVTLGRICRYALDPANGLWTDTVAAVARRLAATRDISK